VTEAFVILAYLAGVYIAAYIFFLKTITKNGVIIFPAKKWLGTVFFITSFAFLINNVWLFYLFLFFILKFLYNKYEGPYGYVSLLYIIPVSYVDIPGFGSINALFDISYHRFLVITLLVPYFFLYGSSSFKRIKWHITDKIILFYAIYLMVMETRDNNLTNSLREIFLVVIDIIIPYYAMRAFIENNNQDKITFNTINYSLSALFFTSIILALIGILESIKGWHFYNQMVINLFSDKILYYYRSGFLRATATSSSPIILGYILMIGLGIIQYYANTNKLSKTKSFITSMILAIGLFFTVSRGPWLATAAMYLTFLLFSQNAISQYFKVAIAMLFSGLILSFTSLFDKFISVLPLVGNTNMETIDYRARLIDVSWIVFLKNPLFGDSHFLETPEMESMRQGQGIIDMVNVFAHIALQYGGIGLFLFSMIFLTAIFSTYKSIRNQRETKNEYWLSVLFLSLLVGIIFTIATVSNIDFIPITYWLILALTISHISISCNKPSSDV